MDQRGLGQTDLKRLSRLSFVTSKVVGFFSSFSKILYLNPSKIKKENHANILYVVRHL